MSTPNKWFPDPTPLFHFPFYYATLSSLTVFYRAPIKALQPYLTNTTLAPAEVGGRGSGVVTMEFQNYTAHLGSGQAPSNPGMSTTNEVELNIIAYPERWKQEGRVPDISFEDFVLGQEQTKTLGGYRVNVPADNQVAVKAGADEFGEQKFFTLFDYQLPCENNPPGTSCTDWDYTVLDPAYAAKLKSDNPKKVPRTPAAGYIYRLQAHLGGLTPQVGNPSPITLFSTLPAKPPACAAANLNLAFEPQCADRRRPVLPDDILVASNWNIRGSFSTYFTGLKAETVQLQLGRSKDPMRLNMQKLLAEAKLGAVRVYQTPPAATESRPYLVNV
ncbi:MAG: hypothetical protein JO307_02795 [Bryobacterales bacterium]|nr:hypothetical protein [Bryobacterales bacterium]MBV9398294.1 hypothetical protein [Bryobacterales bacterium]